MIHPALAAAHTSEPATESIEPKFELTPAAIAYLARMGLAAQSRRRVVRGGR